MTKRRKRKVQKIGLALHNIDHAFQREKLLGIVQFLSRQVDCHLEYDESLSPFLDLATLSNWRGDGLITEIYSAEEEEIIKGLDMPIVNTSSYRSKSPIHTVCPNNRELGITAAKHLLDSDLDRFAFAGKRFLDHANDRYQGFASYLKSQGIDCDETLIVDKPGDQRILTDSTEVIPPKLFVERLRKIKLPVGVFASSDRIGTSVLLACQELNLRCPDDVVLIGVDNDEVFSQLSLVGLTSILPNSRKIGFEAAKLLKSLMDGKAIESKRVEISPEGIVERDSTNLTRAKYEEVGHALRLIRNHCHEDIDVESIVSVLPVSRRWLETKFKEEIGHGISQEIRRVRVEKAKKLLRASDQPLDRVASACGFNSVLRFNFAFQKILGMTASEYRGKGSR